MAGNALIFGMGQMVSCYLATEMHGIEEEVDPSMRFWQRKSRDQQKDMCEITIIGEEVDGLLIPSKIQERLTGAINWFYDLINNFTLIFNFDFKAVAYDPTLNGYNWLFF